MDQKVIDQVQKVKDFYRQSGAKHVVTTVNSLMYSNGDWPKWLMMMIVGENGTGLIVIIDLWDSNEFAFATLACGVDSWAVTSHETPEHKPALNDLRHLYINCCAEEFKRTLSGKYPGCCDRVAVVNLGVPGPGKSINAVSYLR